MTEPAANPQPQPVDESANAQQIGRSIRVIADQQILEAFGASIAPHDDRALAVEALERLLGSLYPYSAFFMSWKMWLQLRKAAKQLVTYDIYMGRIRVRKFGGIAVHINDGFDNEIVALKNPNYKGAVQ